MSVLGSDEQINNRNYHTFQQKGGIACRRTKIRIRKSSSGKMKRKEFEKELEKAAGRTCEVAEVGGT